MITGETGTWDVRLVRGLAGMGAPVEATDALVTTLGALGCEAEFGLGLLYPMAVAPQPTPAQGEMWLRQCFQLGQRLARITNDLAVALQAYLAALEAADPSLAASQEPLTSHRINPKADSWISRFDATPDVWWPERGGVVMGQEPIELWLRRAGFAYRHVVNVGLPEHIEAMAETLSLVLHALQTLPPRGVLTRASLYLGLQEISAETVGDLAPHHIYDIDTRHVGLLTGITTILRFAASEAAPIDGDIIWARGELARARLALQGHQRRSGGGRNTRPLSQHTGNLWVRQLVAEWEQTITQLEAIRVAQATTSAR